MARSLAAAIPPTHGDDDRLPRASDRGLSAALSSLVIGALLVQGVGAVVLLISAAWLGVAVIIAALGPRTNAVPLEIISR